MSGFNLCEPPKCFFLAFILPHFITHIYDMGEIKEYLI